MSPRISRVLRSEPSQRRSGFSGATGTEASRTSLTGERPADRWPHVATTSNHTPYAASLAVPLAGEPCEHERMLRLASQVQASRRVDPLARLAAGRAGGRIRTDVF